MENINIEEYAHGRQFYMGNNVEEFLFMKKKAEELKMDSEFHWDETEQRYFILMYKEDYEKLTDYMVSKKKESINVVPTTFCKKCGNFIAISELSDDLDIKMNIDDWGCIEESFVISKCPHCGEEIDITDDLKFKKHETKVFWMR